MTTTARLPMLAALLLLGSCRVLGLVGGEPCATDADCAIEATCVDATCAVDDPSQGEGEGEGDVEELDGDGDPNLLSPFITAASTCDPIGRTLLWPVTVAETTAGSCEVQLTNDDPLLPQDIFGVEVSAGFSLDAVDPTPPTELAPGQQISILMSTVAPTAGGRDGTLTVQGPRAATFGLAVHALATGAAPLLRADRGCNIFGGADVDAGESCAMALINTGDAPVTLSSRSVAPDDDFNFGGSFSLPITLPARAGASFSVVARPLADRTVPRSSTGRVTWETSAGALSLLLDATFDEPVLVARDSEDCAPDDTFASCDAFPALAQGATVPAVRMLRLHNNGQTDIELDAGDGGQSAIADVFAGEIVPFLLSPGETRTLPLLALPTGTGAGEFSEEVRLVGQGGQLARVSVSGTVTP